MSDEHESDERRFHFLEELVEEHAEVAGDIIELDPHTWAIHGSIAVDGDIILAEFDREDDARATLDRLGPNLDATS